MVKTVLFMLLSAHFLADFYFQSSKLSDSKRSNSISLLIHCGIHFIAMVILTIPVINLKVSLVIVAITVSHYIIDLFKSRFEETPKVYIIDQILHIGIIFVSALILSNDVYSYFTISYLSWILALIVIINPVRITLQKTLINFKPEDDQGYANAGALIGILERVIILMLLSQSQYIAISFVITAKSIVRYDKISKDIRFSEYYLLGTLTSLLSVIVVYIFVIA